MIAPLPLKIVHHKGRSTKPLRGGNRPTTSVPRVSSTTTLHDHCWRTGRRIRHSGFLANRFRGANLERCRKLLGESARDAGGPHEQPHPAPARDDHATRSPEICPMCGCGRMVSIACLERDKRFSSTDFMRGARQGHSAKRRQTSAPRIKSSSL